jgi:hypothetical protein
MWIRITCPNGHPLDAERLEAAARSQKCPECKAVVSMWTKVTCPQGHVLKVRTKHGGGKGKCPECQQLVRIPEFDIEQVIELLLPKGTRVAGLAAVADTPRDEEVAVKKRLPPAGKGSYKLPSMAAFDSNNRPGSCSFCGAMMFPGATVCTNCGRS